MERLLDVRELVDLLLLTLVQNELVGHGSLLRRTLKFTSGPVLRSVWCSTWF
jgi:hypothetical protein